ncbi:MAG: hypothetical protein PHT33_02180 [bacterium]|nr:hypothetical protein [bacterium]
MLRTAGKLRMQGKELLLRVCFLLCLCVMAAVSPGQADTNLQVYNAVWRPDANGYSGSLHVYLKNTGGNPLPVTAVKLDGRNIGPLVMDEIVTDPLEFRRKYLTIENKAVLWYDVRPNPVPAASITELVIRTSMPAKQAGDAYTVTVDTKVGTLEVPVTVVSSPARVSSISLSSDLKSLNIFLEKELPGELSVSSVSLDDRPVKASVFSREFLHGKAYVSVATDRLLDKGSFHFVKVIFNSGSSVVYSFRAIASEFIIGAMSNSRKGMEEHFISYTGSCRSTLQQTEYDYERGTAEDVVFADPVAFKKGNLRYPHPRWKYFLMDEPDGSKSGWMRMCREMMRSVAFCRELDPEAPVHFSVDHSGWPNDCYAFAGISDLIFVHSYNLEAKLRSSTMDHCYHARRASAPLPFWFVAGVGPHYMREAGMTGKELLLQCYYALMGGSKGIIYYPLHDLMDNWPDAWAELGRINAVFYTLGPLLADADIWPLVATERNDVDQATLVSGRDAIVLLAVKRHQVAEGSPFNYAPVGKVITELEVPSWFNAADVFSVSDKGLEPVDYTSRGGKLIITFPLDLAKPVVIAGNKELRQQLMQRYTDEVKPRLSVIDKK